MVTLLETIDTLDTVNDDDRFEPQCIFAEGGPDAACNARAIVCPGDSEGSFNCTFEPELSYVLMVEQAKECIEVWSEWRQGQMPTAQEKFAAVMYYSRHDAWLPVEQFNEEDPTK